MYTYLWKNSHSFGCIWQFYFFGTSTFVVKNVNIFQHKIGQNQGLFLDPQKPLIYYSWLSIYSIFQLHFLFFVFLNLISTLSCKSQKWQTTLISFLFQRWAKARLTSWTVRIVASVDRFVKSLPNNFAFQTTCIFFSFLPNIFQSVFPVLVLYFLYL